MQLPLEPTSDVPLYRQIADGIRDLIARGSLRSSTRLPSTRRLAEDLGVSRCTASLAYEELSRFGYIVSPSHAGTFVAARKPQDAKPFVIDESIRYDKFSNAGSRLMMLDVLEDLDAELFPQLNFFSPSLENLPKARWSSTMCHVRQRLAERDYVSDVFGSSRLRRILASLLERSRGIACHEDQICVFTSAQLALDVFARLLIDPGDCVLVENPGFPGMRRTASAYSGVVRPIAVDHGGIVTEDLWQGGGKLLYVSPEHQMPTGVTLCQSRRYELLSWANRMDALIIEDDFDSEFSYAGQTGSLKSLDGRSRVIYLSSFWTTLFPLCRLAFAVIPAFLLPALKNAKALVDRHADVVEQETLAAFIEDGSYERHLKKTRLEYARNRETLIATLNRLFGNSVIIAPGSSGTTLSVRFQTKGETLLTALREDELIAAAQAVGLPMVSTESFYLGGRTAFEFLLSFSNKKDDLAKKLALFKQRLCGTL